MLGIFNKSAAPEHVVEQSTQAQVAKLKRAVVKQAPPGKMAAKAQGYKQLALCWPLPAGYTLKLPASHEGPDG